MTQREINDIINLKELLFNSNHKIITIAGLSKNAGKTSFLNYLIQNAPDTIRLALTTTGHDGENIDLVTGLNKPRIKFKKGNYFTTIGSAVKELSLSVRIISRLNFTVLSKPLYLCEALEAIEGEIYGASTVEQQIALCDQLKSFGIDYIIIDGSLDRKSIALSSYIDHIILLASPVVGNIKAIKTQLNRLVSFSKMALFTHSNIRNKEVVTYFLDSALVETEQHSLFKHEAEIIDIIKKSPDWIYIPSALTDYSFNQIMNALNDYQGKIIFNHPLRLMCSDNNYAFLTKKQIFTLNPFPLTAIALNSFSADMNHLDCAKLRKEMSETFKELPVIDIQDSFFKEG